MAPIGWLGLACSDQLARVGCLELARVSSVGSGWLGLAWAGSDWLGLTRGGLGWLGLAWAGSGWSRLAQVGLGLLG